MSYTTAGIVALLVGTGVWLVFGRKRWRRWMAGDYGLARQVFIWTTVCFLPTIFLLLLGVFEHLPMLPRVGLGVLISLLVLSMNLLYMWLLGPWRKDPTAKKE